MHLVENVRGFCYFMLTCWHDHKKQYWQWIFSNFSVKLGRLVIHVQCTLFYHTLYQAVNYNYDWVFRSFSATSLNIYNVPTCSNKVNTCSWVLTPKTEVSYIHCICSSFKALPPTNSYAFKLWPFPRNFIINFAKHQVNWDVFFFLVWPSGRKLLFFHRYAMNQTGKIFLTARKFFWFLVLNEPVKL